METQIFARAVIYREIKILGGLECIMQIYDEWRTGLLQNVGFDDSIFQLLLKDKVFLFECFESIVFSSGIVFY